MNEYLKTVLEQIRCKKARPFIQQELQEHIECQIEKNICDGMDYESAEKEAVKDMGDPIETGILLDRIHKPQIAWKLLFLIVLLSVVGVMTHTMITKQIDGATSSISSQYAIHVVVGIIAMLGIYFVDYTLLAKISKLIAVIFMAMCLLTLFFGECVGGATCWIRIGRWAISIQALMLFYVPIYGGIIYQYYGTSYRGLIKAIAWLVLPVFLVLQMPSIMSAGLMLISMLVMLTMAICNNWFVVHKKKALAFLWGICMVLPFVVFMGIYFRDILVSYQKEHIRSLIFHSPYDNYMTSTLCSLLETSQWIGSSGKNISGILPSFNGDYVLMYLSATYGIMVATLVCCVLASMILIIFGIAVKQKNQLGMVMGCGCGMIFLVSFLINVLQNLGNLPPNMTFLPFLSAGGSYIVVSYGLIGIVLSIYRYKNIYPRHVKLKMTIES